MEYQPDIKQITGEGGLIAAVEPGSIAAGLGLRPGDHLVAIGAQRLRDVIDYRFAIAEEQIEILARTADGEKLFVVEKDPDKDLGIEFTEPLFDRLRTCNNKCPFCFLTQMPKGMRKTLYLKDDDYRLSFLYNNFVTMTNLSEEDWRRIETQRLSPMNISVHATDPFWRSVMLGKRDLPDVVAQIRRLAQAGISVHTQVVACPGVNDGEVLRQTVEQLAALAPTVESISVVPVGLTKFRFDGKRPSSIRAAIQVHETPDWIDTNWERQPLWEDGTQQTADSGRWTVAQGESGAASISPITLMDSAKQPTVHRPSSTVPSSSAAAQPSHDPELGFCSRLATTADVPLRCYTANEAAAVIDLLEPLGERFRNERGITMVYPSDEFYILAGRSLPEADFYDAMPQYSNGIGMVRDFLDIWAKAQQRLPARLSQPTSLALVCGTLVAPLMGQVAERLNQIAGLRVQVLAITNQFFGETVTVSGLLMGQDIVAALRASGATRALLPRVMFDYKGERTLDEYSPQRIAEESGLVIAMAGDPDELVRYVRALATAG